MELLTLILTLVALGSAILVYYKAGGVSDLKQQADRIASSENFRNSVASLRAAAETVKEKTGEAMAKLATSSKRKINGENRTPGRKVSRGFEDLRKGMVAAKKGSKSAFQNISAWTQKGFQSLVELKSGASKQFV
ncbi:MAG: hypothetical protein GTO24_09075, partial [candidate division Zixibacteria bacterium]|nr:hypothetical protein [candidate division Zixibacteria bacterium]